MIKKITPLIVLITLFFGSYALINYGLRTFLSGPRLKAMLVEPVEKKLGRDVEIGSIKVSLLKGINISEVVVKDLGPDQDLASIGSFNLSYDIMSLLKGRLVITSVDIVNPKFNLVRNKEGISNIETIGAPGTEKEEEPNYDDEPIDPIPLELIFDSININNAVLSFKDMTGELPNVEADANASFSVKLGKSLADTVIKGSASIHANSEYRDKKPVLMVEVAFSQNSVSFHGDLSMAFDKFLFNGQVDNYATSPNIILNVKSPKLNLDNVLALISAGKTPVTASQTKPVSEEKEVALPVPENPETSAKQTPTNPASEPTEVAAASQTPVPDASTPAKPLGFSCLGEITISELVSKDFKANNIKVSYTLKDEILLLKNIGADMFGGNVGGNINLNIIETVPPIKGNVSTKNIQVSELLKTMGKTSESLSGALTTNFTFTGKGLDWPSLQKTMNGKGDYTLSEGGINSPITSTLAVVLDIPELSNLQYKDLSGSFDIVDGDVLLNASLKGSQFDMESTGSVGLNGDLNMPLSLHLSPEYSQRLGEKASFSKHLADDQGRISLRLMMTGTTSEPKIRMDEKQAVEKAKQVVVKKAEEELQKVISKELGATSEEGNIVKGLSEKFLQQMLKN